MVGATGPSRATPAQERQLDDGVRGVQGTVSMGTSQSGRIFFVPKLKELGKNSPWRLVGREMETSLHIRLPWGLVAWGVDGQEMVLNGRTSPAQARGQLQQSQVGPAPLDVPPAHSGWGRPAALLSWSVKHRAELGPHRPNASCPCVPEIEVLHTICL